MKTDLKITKIENLEDLYRYKEVWAELIENCKFYGPWLSFDWFELWLNYFGSEAAPVTLIVHDKNRVLAIAPFCIIAEKDKIGIFLRKIKFIGNELSPIKSLIINNLNELEVKEVISIIIKYFVNEFKEWDVMELDKIPQENKIFSTMNKLIEGSCLMSKKYIDVANWYIDGVNYEFSDYFEKLPKKLRKDIQYCKRRMDRDGNLEFKIASKPNEVNGLIPYYYEVRDKSWKAPEKSVEFITAFTKKCAENGWLKLGFLFFDGVPIAAQKWMLFGNTAYIWDILHDESFNKYSPGKVLTAYILEKLMNENNIEQIDFMTGDEPYKKDWTPKKRHRNCIKIFNNNFKGYFTAFLIIKILPILKSFSNLKRIRKDDFRFFGKR